MSEFKWRHFEGEIVLWAVRWYCRYGISYRDLEQMMGERGVGVDHSTIYRWVQRYAPEIEKRLRWQWRCPQSTSWRVDETYVKVRGKLAYLYRALDKEANTIDFYLSPTWNAKAAKRFLGKAFDGLKAWEQPQVINTDRAPTYGIAISELKAEGKCLEETVHRQVKYLNNVVEADHGKLKQLIRPVRGFKTLKTAYATIMGFEVMRALRKGQAAVFNLTQDIRGEARIVERAFGIGANALAEAAAMITKQLELQPAWRPDATAPPDAPVRAYFLQQSRWKYLFRAVDKHGLLIDFMLADRRNTRAAHRFLGKALTTMRHWPLASIITDQLGSYPKAIRRLQREGKLSADTKHRTCKYLNNIIEADHGALKRVIGPTRGFQTMRTAAATIKGFEVMRMIRRGHCLTCKPGVKDQVRFVNKLFDIFSVAA